MDLGREIEIRKEREYSARIEARPETLKDLAIIGEHEIVLIGECKVSTSPLVSFGFCNCKALIAQNGKSMGLSHILSIIEDPNCLYHSYVKEILQLVPFYYRDRLKAMIVAGQKPESLERFCDDLGIEVEDHYYDPQEVGYTTTDRKRDIIVIPSLREVMIYTKNGRITRRFSE